MFTGLVEKTGIIKKIDYKGGNTVLEIQADRDYIYDIKQGDSISIDGVCLTNESQAKNAMIFTAIEDTVKKSIIKDYKINQIVNIEKSLTLNKYLGGHIVNGHIDCTGSVEKIVKTKSNTELEIQINSKFGKYLVENDSIAVNGISLTIKCVYGNSFTLSIIPYTMLHTSLSGGLIKNVNIEINHLTKSIYEFAKRGYR